MIRVQEARGRQKEISRIKILVFKRADFNKQRELVRRIFSGTR